MTFDSIRLQNFRSYADDSFEFTPAVNIIVGPNASGKTNLLESVLVAARGSSYRAKDHDMVMYEAPWARIEARVGVDERIVIIERQDHRAAKQFKINNQTLQRLTLPRTVPVVVFEPNHLQLLHGAPELRRQFLDDLLEQIIPTFGVWRRQYRRILAQRNALLKKGEKLANDQVFVWNIRLSEFGERIAHTRHQLVESLQDRIQDMYAELVGSAVSIELRYDLTVSRNNYATELLRKLEAHTPTDFVRGFTAHGPHREDMGVLLNGHPAHATASRGETRTLLLVLMMIEAVLLEEARGQRPLLLLDDVFSELDGQRRQSLTNFLQPYQTFITTTDADVVIQHFTESAHIIPLSG